jgi:PAS domain S-box-containing protein
VNYYRELIRRFYSLASNGKIQILLVDDDPSTLLISKAILESQNEFEISTASSTENALQELNRKTYDAIVSDYEMPLIDGLDFLRELNKRKNETPFILFTGKGREEVAVKALNLGASGYFNKHGNPETVYGELSHGIASAVKRSKLARDLKQKYGIIESVLENIGAGLTIIDRDYRIVWANKMLKQIGAVENRLCYSTYNKLNAVCPDCGVKKIFENNANFDSHEYTNTDSKGEVFWTELIVTPIKDEAGNLTAALELAVPITERKKTEACLLQSEEQFRQLFSCMPSAVAIYEAVDNGDDFVFKDFNVAAEKIEHLKKDDIIGKRVTDVFPGVRAFGIFEVFKRVWQSGKAEYYPDHLYQDEHDLGTWRENWVYLLPNRNLIAIYNDITKRKNNEELTQKLLNIAQQEKNKLSSLLDSINDEVWFANTEKKFTLANPTARKTFNIDSDTQIDVENLAKSTEVFRGNGSPRPMDEAPPLRALRGEVVKNQEEIVRTPASGELKYRQVNSAPVKDETGNIIGAVSVVRDITEYKKAEEIVKKSEARYRELANFLPEIVFETDLTGRLTFFSQRAFEITGFTQEELEGGLNMLQFIAPQDQEKAKENTKNSLSGRKIGANEYTIFKKDGTTFSALVRTAPIISENKVAGLRGIVVDISERKKVEEELEKNQQKLSVVNEKLHVVGALTRHDVANKLMVIRTIVYLLKKQIGDNPKQANYLQDIDSAIDSSDKFFEFSRLYEKIGAEQPANMNIAQCFNQATTHFSSLKGIKLVNETQGLEATADSLLPQLFYNLIDNSLKHGQTVTQIRLRYTEDGEGVKLLYEDNGVGIPNTDKSKIFDAGFTTGKGSGLGLQLVKKMIDVYGWTIKECGKQGKGAKFVITIPQIEKNGQSN